MPNRLVLPVVGCDVTRPNGHGRRYDTGRDGTVTPKDAHDERALREAGATLAGVSLTINGRDRHCVVCGFNSFFATCSRCGGECP
ncbi:MAG: hypothetical protein ACRDRL_24045 [Sciscionella sp.]